MRDIEAAAARLSAVPVPLRDLWNPDTCPLALLPWLAWAYSVDKWDSSWNETQQREMVKNSLGVHRYKGSLGAVERALNALGYHIRLIEWWEENPQADAYTFRLDVLLGNTGFDEVLYSRIEQLVLDTKNVRSHLASIRLSMSAAGALYLGAAPCTGEDVTIDAWALPESVTEGVLFTGIGTIQEINLLTGFE